LRTLDEIQRDYIREVLRQTKGMVGGKGGAAEILGLPPSTLRSRMKKLGIK
jgi:formate hydrogenlyase transcriptional activator